MNKQKIQIEETFKNFSPRDYHNEYFSKVLEESSELLRFFIFAYSFIPKNVSILEFGGGPTIYQLITAATKAKEIYFSDYLEPNLTEIKRWKDNSSESFDWSFYIKRALQLEGELEPSSSQIEGRTDLLKTRITKFILCDAFKKNPIGKTYKNSFDVVSVNFVPESISKNKKEWIQAMQNICSLIKPGGFLVMTSLKKAKYWHSGIRVFPAANINTKDIEKLLTEMKFDKRSYKIRNIQTETLNNRGKEEQGYNGIICILAKKES